MDLCPISMVFSLGEFQIVGPWPYPHDRCTEAAEAQKAFGTLWETCVSLFSHWAANMGGFDGWGKSKHPDTKPTGSMYGMLALGVY